MLKSFKNILVLVAFGLLASCSSVTDENLSGDFTITAGKETAFFFVSDYSTGQLYVTQEDDLSSMVNTGVNLGGDAVIKLENGLLFVLHRSYDDIADNLQVYNPLTLELLHETSTGTQTNPQDMIIDGSRAYISLYSPTTEGYDFIILNWETGSIEAGFSFESVLEADGFPLAWVASMERLGNKIYILLQDLGYDQNEDGALGFDETYLVNALGKLVVFNLDTQTYEAITLQGQNPWDIAVSEENNKLVITQASSFSDFSDNYGGIEILDLDSEGNYAGTSLFLDDELLAEGGYVNKVLVSSSHIFAIQSGYAFDEEGNFYFTSNIIRLPLTISDESESELYLSGSDARDMALDSQNRLWVAWRVIGEDGVEGSGVDIYDLTSEALLQSLIPTVDGVALDSFSVGSIAIGDL